MFLCCGFWPALAVRVLLSMLRLINCDRGGQYLGTCLKTKQEKSITGGHAAGLLYWVCHAHDRLIILHSDPSTPEGQEYVISTAPAPSGNSQQPTATLEESPKDGWEMWTPLVQRPKQALAHIHPMAIEDFVAYRSHLVLSCREGGLPVLRAVPWSEFGISPASTLSLIHI